MSVQALSWVLEHSKAQLGTRLVLLSIANHARQDGTGAWPSIETIARESRMSERAVRYAVRELEQSGELYTDIGNGPHGTNMYSLPMMDGANIAPGKLGGGQNTTKNGSEGGKIRQGGGQLLPPIRPLTVSKENRPAATPHLSFVDLVNQSIEESQRTHEPADKILARLRLEHGFPRPQ